MAVVSQIVRWGQQAATLAARAPAPARAGAVAGAAVAPSTQVTLSSARAATAAATYTDRIKPSGNLRIDALLAGGRRWFHEAGADGSVPSAVAKKTLTYSFIESAAGLAAQDANGFQALDESQRQRVRDALAQFSAVIDVQFQQVDSGGDLKYGANVQGASAGYARYPNEGSQVMLAANQGSFAGGWEEGSYGWQVLLHETAHAIGLKHPGNYNAGGGGTPGPYLAAADDHRNNTLMSYRTAPNMQRVVANGNSLSRQTVQASTLQGLDIAALQYLYGASTTTSAATYSWATDAAISQTIWNPNVGSAIDLSNQTKNNLIDLRPGRWSSMGIRDPYADTGFTRAEYAALKTGGRSVASVLGTPTYDGRNNLFIAKGSRVTQATGGSGNDTFVANVFGNAIAGGAGNDRVFWNGGDLSFDGGEGRDVVFVKKVQGARWALAEDKSALTLTRTNAATGESSTLGTLSLAGIEAVRFWDGANLAPVGTALYSATA
jgi:serralysin